MSSEEQKVLLVSSDGVEFRISLKVAEMIETVKVALDSDDDAETEGIPLEKVKSVTLEKVIEFCEYYQENEKVERHERPISYYEELDYNKEYEKLEDVIKPKWYVDFINSVDEDVLFQIVLAADYIGIKPLYELSCLAVSINVLQGKSAEEMCQTFHVHNMNADGKAANDNAVNGNADGSINGNGKRRSFE